MMITERYYKNGYEVEFQIDTIREVLTITVRKRGIIGTQKLDFLLLTHSTNFEASLDFHVEYLIAKLEKRKEKQSKGNMN